MLNQLVTSSKTRGPHFYNARNKTQARTLSPPAWNTMDTPPRAAIWSFSRPISFFTSSMNALRSLLTPLLLASTASALHMPRANMPGEYAPLQTRRYFTVQ